MRDLDKLELDGGTNEDCDSLSSWRSQKSIVFFGSDTSQKRCQVLSVRLGVGLWLNRDHKEFKKALQTHYNEILQEGIPWDVENIRKIYYLSRKQKSKAFNIVLLQFYFYQCFHLIITSRDRKWGVLKRCLKRIKLHVLLKKIVFDSFLIPWIIWLAYTRKIRDLEQQAWATFCCVMRHFLLNYLTLFFIQTTYSLPVSDCKKTKVCTTWKNLFHFYCIHFFGQNNFQ